MAQGFSTNESIAVSARTSTVQGVKINYDDATGTYSIPVKAGQMVLGGGVVILTAFNGSGAALTVGDGDDADGYIDTTDIDVTTARTAATPAVKLFEDSSNPYANGKLYVADDTVDFAFTQGTTATTGALVAYIELVDFSNYGIAVA